MSSDNEKHKDLIDLWNGKFLNDLVQKFKKIFPNLLSLTSVDKDSRIFSNIPVWYEKNALCSHFQLN